MTKTKAWLKIVRFNNLLLIVLAQAIYRYSVIGPSLKLSNAGFSLPEWLFWLLVLSTVLIAAGGNIINDIFDFSIDEINKPQKMIVGKYIDEKKAETVYFILTIIGVSIGFFVAFMIGKFELGIIHMITATMLYYYSRKYKYMVLWGNLSIAFLSAMVYGLIWIFEFFAARNDPMQFVEAFQSFSLINSFTLAMVSFTFLISLIREIIKDIQDISGDKMNGCRTLPIVLDIKKTKYVVLSLIVIEIVLLAYIQWMLFEYHFILIAVFLFITQILHIVIGIMILKAHNSEQFGRLATFIKITMLTGIVTSILFGLSI